MEDNHLICNFKDCYKVLNESAYVTFCSHIFCVDHGKKLKSNLSGGCFACSKILSDHQITECKLNITANSKKLLLAGHDPNTIIEVANSALGFWNYQKKHEYLKMKRSLEHYRAKLQNQAQLVEEKDSRIDKLQMEIEKLRDERQSLKAELAANTEEGRHRSKKFHFF